MEGEGIIKDLATFSEELRKYYSLRNQMGRRKFATNELAQVADLRRTLVTKSGKYKKLIAEITEKIFIAKIVKYFFDLRAFLPRDIEISCQSIICS